MVKLTIEEQALFNRIISYYIKMENNEIENLKIGTNNPQFIATSTNILELLNSIKTKVEKHLC